MSALEIPEQLLRNHAVMRAQKDLARRVASLSAEAIAGGGAGQCQRLTTRHRMANSPATKSWKTEEGSKGFVQSFTPKTADHSQPGWQRPAAAGFGLPIACLILNPSFRRPLSPN
jgi:hypothetical protein